MFLSSKYPNSPRTNKNSLQNTLNETANGEPRSFIQPKITSTPLVRRDSIFATPPKPHILSPRRYSLSEVATPPRANKKDLTRIPPAGPLLASTRYNVNVSTYEDTKSPGLAGRIVQYNEETEREREYQRPSTHQAKYGSPGLFPVVHLFKKKLPSLEPKRVTVRIASPDYSRHHSQEYNRKLLEGIIKPSSPTQNNRLLAQQNSEVNSSTRSVLDALKEISRKRIHATEEYELNEDNGKRLRTDNFNGIDSNKRLRDDSPLLDSSTSPNKPTSKRICMYDEYAASCSSMDFSFKKAEESGPKRKLISISTLTDNPKDSKQVKLINAETQTTVNEAAKTVPQQEETLKNDDKKDDEPASKKEDSPPKVFDNMPLDRIRKNRLAALIGNLAGRDAPLSPKPGVLDTLDRSTDTPAVIEPITIEASKTPEKPLVSILSSPKKSSPNKSNKHVHFSVPESTSQITVTLPSVISYSGTQSSTSITAPISSSSESKITFGSSRAEATPETPAPPSSPVGLNASSSDSTTAVPVITFGSGSNSNSTTSLASKESSGTLLQAESSKTGFATPNFQFKAPPTSVVPASASSTNLISSPPTATRLTFGSTTSNPATSKASPPKMGGFKFDLKMPSSTPTAGAASISFGSTSETNTSKSNASFGNTVGNSGSTSAPGGFSFGAKSTTTNNSTVSSAVPAFGANAGAPAPSTNSLANATFKFGPSNAENKPSASIGFGTATATTSVSFGTTNTPSSAPAFKIPDTAVSSSAPATFNAAKSPLFSFGSQKPASGLPTFGAPATTAAAITFGAPTTTAAITFGAPSTTTPSSGFGAPTGGFGAPAITSGGFGAPAVTSSSGFGAPAVTPSSGFGAPAVTPSGFGAPATSLPSTGFGGPAASSSISGFEASAASANTGFGSATSMFGNNKPAAPFGATGGVSAAFGTSTPNASPFGKNTPSAFNQITTQSSFGTPTTTVSFGTANAFAGTTTTASSMFGGANSVSAGFGAKTGGFGSPSTNASIFGGATNTQATGFGTSTSKPGFGTATSSPFGNTTVASAAPAFGSNTAPSFTFGAKTTANSFGGSNAFGTTTTTTSSIGFGTATTPAFTATNSFGSGSSNFAPNNAFAPSSTPAFGVVTTSTQSSGFGTTNTPTFGAPNSGFNAANKPSAFGNSSAPAFGTNTNAPFGSSAPTPAFGATNNASGFGTSSATSAFSKPQPTQNAFGSGAPNAFASNNSFGATQPQAAPFGNAAPVTTQSAVFSFGATAPTRPAGVFSFGAASTNEPPKPTFNFTGGSTSPAFGAAATPSFGNAAPPAFGAGGAPAFNAPQPVAPNMFSIGSGSTSGRTRTQLKAKRRT